MAREDLVKVPAVILGGRLRGKRKSLRMSQHQLGGEEFSPSYVSAVERGKIRPSLKALYILADRLGEPVTYFLQEEAAAQAGNVLEEQVTSATGEILMGRPGDAVARLQGISLAGHTLDMQARARLCLGQALIANNQPVEAVSELQEALRLADRAGDALLAAQARLYQGIAYYQQQKVGLALDLHRRCLQDINDGAVQDMDFKLLVYRHLGEDLLLLGQQKDAMAYYEVAMQVAKSAGNLRSLAAALWAGSASFQQSNDPLHGRAFALQSIGVFKTLRMLSTAASLHNTYAAVLSAMGQKDMAETIFREAETMAERIGDASVSSTAAIRLGELASERKDYATAETLITRGVADASALGDKLIAGQGLLALAQMYVAQEQRAAAEEQFRAAIAMLEELGAADALSSAYFRYGQALVAWGETTKGSEFLEKAYLQSRRA